MPKLRKLSKKLHRPLKGNKKLRAGLFVLAFALVGSAFLVLTRAAGPYVALEPENATIASPATKVNDATASGGSYVKFGAATVTPPTDGAMPTKDNTGPRYSMTSMTADQFLDSGVCNRQKISGDVNIDKASMKGKTFNITDCEITGMIKIYINTNGNQLPLADMPIINIDYSDILNGFLAYNASKLTVNHTYIVGSQMGLKDAWAPYVTGPAPYTFMNSMFYGYYASQPTHTEAFHTGDYGTGMTFTNVAFVQQGGTSGPTSGVSAVINFDGKDSVFDGCYFLWDGPTPSYHTVEINDGSTGIVIKNSWFDSGANYIYPSSAQITFQNNKNYDTGALLNLP